MTLDSYIAQYTGVSGVGDTPENKGQCVGLVEVFFDLAQQPHVWGNAKDLYANAGSTFDRGTTWPAPKGAAGVMDGSWGGGAGHTWLSLGDGRVFEQNNPTGHAPRVSNYGLTKPNGYVGYIIPKGLNQGDEMATIPNQDNWFWRFNKLMIQIRGRELSREEFQANFVGKDIFGMVEAVSDNAEADAATNAQNIGKVAVRDGWDQQIYGLQDQLKAQTALTNSAQAQVADLTDKLAKVTANSDPNNLVISEKGWAALWQALKSFVNKNN